MAKLSVSLLGPMEIALDGKPISGFEYNKVRALLVYLALETARAHTRSSLAALLWPDRPERTARQNLSQALTTLRHALGDSNFLLTTSDSIQLNPTSEYEVDVACFLAALNACDAHTHRSWHTCATCCECLGEVVQLYRGDFLAQFFLPDSEPFEEWALLQREHLRQRALRALERLAQAAEWRGAYDQAADYTRRQIELEPLLEASQRELMRLLALSGQTSTALAQYEYLRRTLAQELDAEPEAETTALRDRIRASPSGVTHPFRRFQPPSSHLPSLSTPLIGRAPEMQALCERLHAGAERALTLVGPPGIGKTRLALQVAHQLHLNFEDGAHWVELAPLSDPTLLPLAIAQVLGVKERTGQKLEATLIEYLRRKHMLLALDNFEQLLDAAACVAELLTACPALQVIVTSRASLRIRAEQQFPLSPLAVPENSHDVEAIARAPAVQLFVERARAARPSFELDAENATTIAAICTQLDGLPLALELIAARVESLSPAEMLRQLEHRLAALADGPRDLPQRQQTLRSAIQWSFDLLSAEVQRVFSHLGVFVGGFTLEAAAQVTGDREQGIDNSLSPVTDHLSLHNVLATLRRHSLLQPLPSPSGRGSRFINGGGGEGDETRFTMLETIRAYALERLAARGELEAARRRHAAHFLALAERAEPELEGPEQSEWLDRLERDHDNLRAALAWGQEANDDARLRMAVALGRFWEVRGYLGEGRRWLSQALERCPDAALSLRGQALDKAGALAYRQGDYAGARALNESSLSIWQHLEDSQAIARTLRRLGTVAWDQADGPLARSYYEQSLALAREIGDGAGIAGALNNLGLMADKQGDYAAARGFYEECLPMFRELNDMIGAGHALNNLGLAAWHQDDCIAARAFLEESLATARQIGHKWGIALALLNLGNLAVSQADLASAQTHHQECLTLYRELGDRATASYPLKGLGDVAYRQKDYVLARSLFRESLVMRYETGEKWPIPRNLEGLAQVFRVEGRPERAAHLFGAAESLRESLGGKLTRDYLPEYERETAALRTVLGDTAFTQSWAVGRALTLEQAVAFALGH